MKRNALFTMLSGGDLRSMGRSEEAAAEVLANPPLFGDLIRGMQSSDPVLRMRAAGAAEQVTAHNPMLLERHKKKILSTIATDTQKEVRRYVAQMIPRLSMTAVERKNAVGILNKYLEDPSSVVRTSAMQALADIALGDKRLFASIRKTIERVTESGTPAMKARGKKLLERLALSPPSMTLRERRRNHLSRRKSS